MFRVIAIAAVTIAVIGLILAAPGAGQDRTEERLSALETRVASLESIITGPDAAPTGETHRLRGSLLLDPAIVDFETSLFCARGWKNLPVTIEDGVGAVISAGLLDLGELVETDCHIPFIVENVPDAPTYTIKIRDWRWSFSYQDLASRNWIVELVIDS